MAGFPRPIITKHPRKVKEEIHSNTAYLTRRIGSTTYKIKVHFSDSGTMEEKIRYSSADTKAPAVTETDTVTVGGMNLRCETGATLTPPEKQPVNRRIYF